MKEALAAREVMFRKEKINSLMNKMLTIKDIQNNLGIGKNNAYRLIKSPGFTTIKIGRKYLIPDDEFETWVQNSLHNNLLQYKNEGIIRLLFY